MNSFNKKSISRRQYSGTIFTPRFGQVFLWTVYGECDNLMTMSGHTGSVVQLTFNPAGDTIITASTDKTVLHQLQSQTFISCSAGWSIRHQHRGKAKEDEGSHKLCKQRGPRQGGQAARPVRG